MMPTRSQERCTSSSSCELRKTVRPRSRSSATNVRNSSCIRGQAARRLVEDEQLRLVARRLAEPDLLRVATGQLAEGTVHVRLETLGQRIGAAGVASAADGREEGHQLAAAQARVVGD